jgi:glyoxylase-like metal-dependent hydrolase (beta-lactamase superfamily II)
MHVDETSGKPEMFTGGALETNSYLIPCPGGNILVDAPQGSAEAFRETPVSLLVLTHGHFDHVWDAAAIARLHGCPVAMHRITEEMLADRGLLKRFGLDMEVEPVAASRLLHEAKEIEFLGRTFDLYEVPGHCPGSICLHDVSAGRIYGGDVLFAGGVGRWDLPGGDRYLLLKGIRSKLLPLPAETIVHPGHGPSTSIGQEMKTNPYLQDSTPF